jgi:hypothetical protein
LSSWLGTSKPGDEWTIGAVIFRALNGLDKEAMRNAAAYPNDMQKTKS